MSGRVWVITGTSTGLGLAMARYMLSRGDKVRRNIQ
jgi:NAD(P)-dependent dehydrogenase (short-subunit alcohol dehydrogenase family)